MIRDTERFAVDAETRRALATHPVHGIAPGGAPYVLGRWHKHRAHPRGFAKEALSLVTGLGARNRPQRFMMFGRPRSGTTLQHRLLDQVPGIRCDGEILHHAVLAPRAYIDRVAARCPEPVYGFKVLSYQIFEVQKIADPVGFFEDPHADAVRFVHIRRNTFAQTLSLTTAQATRYYHHTGETQAAERCISLDSDRFLRMLRWNEAMLDYETRLMAAFPHERVTYETDLETPEQHQRTVDRLCALLGVPTAPVTADLKRVTGKGGAIKLANLDELRGAALDGGFGHLVEH